MTSYERKMAEVQAEYDAWVKEKKIKTMANYNGQSRFTKKDIKLADQLLEVLFPKERI